MSELNRRTILKGAAFLAMAASMPRVAQARAPSVVISGGGNWLDCAVSRGFGRWIQRWHAVDVEILSGSEALLDRVGRTRPSLLLVDPGHVDRSLTGWHRRLRQGDPDLPVLYTSSHFSDAFPRAVIESVATEYVQQPVGPGQFRRIVSRHLDAHPLQVPTV